MTHQCIAQLLDQLQSCIWARKHTKGRANTCFKQHSRQLSTFLADHITTGGNMSAANAYEQQREARIAENRRRMEELGLLSVMPAS